MAANTTEIRMPEKSSLTMGSLIGFLLAVALGTFGAVILQPSWVPALLRSLVGADPKAYWYLARGAGFVALGLLWTSMALGLLITNKIARSWPGAPAAFALHEYVSLLGIAFAIFHALILLGDHYINYKLAQILVPFGSVNYHPLWVGLGQIGLYVWTVVALSFYIRQRIGPKLWRLIHFASFFTFVVAVIHGLGSGTDASMPWAQNVYWALGGSFLFLTVYRIVAEMMPEKKPAARPVQRPQS
jgi:predicted ferric reductase